MAYYLFYYTQMPRYYVIFSGRQPGIYQSWHECSQQVLGVRGSVYKRYNTYGDAVRACEETMAQIPDA